MDCNSFSYAPTMLRGPETGLARFALENATFLGNSDFTPRPARAVRWGERDKGVRG